MTDREYQRLRSQEIARYDGQLTKLKAVHQKRLEAIDLVRRMTLKERRVRGTGGPAENDAPATDIEKPGRGLVLLAVREIVAEMHNTFTVRDVMNKLPAGSKLNSVSSALRRLHESGEITEMKAGGGRRATIYSRMGSAKERSTERATA